MYNFKTSDDLSFLRGARVDQLCIGRHSVILQMNESRAITVSCNITISDGGVEHKLDCSNVSGDINPLLVVLGGTIESTRVVSPRELKILFSGTGAMSIHDDSKMYESVVFTAPGITLVV